MLSLTGCLEAAGVGAAVTPVIRGPVCVVAAATCTTSVNFPVHGGCGFTTTAYRPGCA